MSTANNARIIAVIGASGNGKGVYVKERLRRWRGPILVWSPLERTDDYAGVIGGKRVESVAELVAAIKRGETRVVLVPGGDAKAVKTTFDRFCRVAWELRGWCVVVEELSRVTMASWAPPAWKNLSTAGRHQGLEIIGTSQRPAQIDKDFLGNCSEIRCYGLVYPDDAKAMGGAMRIPPDELLDLPQFHYRHRDVRAKTNVSGVVTPPKK
ncbi:hypothetical protein [Burkholderia pseudomultivorans]|uniref:Uncharacterized protein n=1 Tax=Burkholderia pseudomultivorans TaxID=1207504 RepID=A0A132EEM0_9BURK|nr:hypothetical protein [Burkholderia pseudomultivorans]KWF26607.1 hypothetical protein WT56_00330 [Burkholderia pseudomultivorans]